MKKRLALPASVFAFLLLWPFSPVRAEVLSAPSVSGGSACLMDASTGQVLYEKNMDTQYAPASITKIMTTLLAVENSSAGDLLTVSSNAVYSVPRNTSHISLSPGEQITMEQALMAVMLPSANDAANAVAEKIGGSIDGFVSMMNARAAACGASNTHFVNANGLDDPAHLTTAHDMACITREAVRNADFLRYFSTTLYTIPATNMQPDIRNIGSGVKMMFDFSDYYYPDIVGGKSGYTELAKHTLVTYAKRNGLSLICVVMMEPDLASMYKDSISLLDYGLGGFTRVTLSGEDAAAGIAGSDASAQAESFTFLLADGFSVSDLTKSYRIAKSSEDSLTAEVTYSLPQNDRQYGTVTTVEVRCAPVSKAALSASSAYADAVPTIPSPFRSVLLAVCAVLLIAFAAFAAFARAGKLRRRRRRRRQAAVRNGKQSRKPGANR